MVDVSPAIRALYDGDEARARELLGSDEELTVFEAAAFGREQRLTQLLDDDPERAREWSADGFTALHLAAFTGEEGAAGILIERGADLDVPSRHEQIRGVRPLHTAAFAGTNEIARLLLEAGADVNGRSEDGGFTPLHSAAQNGNAELVRLLLDHGADPSLETDDGKRPADLA